MTNLYQLATSLTLRLDVSRSFWQLTVINGLMSIDCRIPILTISLLGGYSDYNIGNTFNRYTGFKRYPQIRKARFLPWQGIMACIRSVIKSSIIILLLQSNGNHIHHWPYHVFKVLFQFRTLRCIIIFQVSFLSFLLQHSS